MLEVDQQGKLTMGSFSKRLATIGSLAGMLLMSVLTSLAVAQVPSNPGKPIGILLVTGDIAQCGEKFKEDEKVADLVDREVAFARSHNVPVKLVLLGDLAYPDGTRLQFRDCFDPKWGKHKSIMLPVPGNHEYVPKRNGKRFRGGKKHARPYFSYFRNEPKDHRGQSLVASEGPRTGYYAFRFPDHVKGPWLLIGLNPYTRSKDRANRHKWLEGKLRENDRLGRNKSPCILAFAHAYRFSSGYHGHGDKKRNSAARLVDTKVMKPPYSILMRHRASVFLSGHDHHFEQFGRQDEDGNFNEKGIRSFVVGTGGVPLYLEVIKKHFNTQYIKQARNQEHLIGDKHGVLRLELHADRYAWVFIPTEGPPIYPKVDQDKCNM